MDSDIHPHAKYLSYSQLLITAEKKQNKTNQNKTWNENRYEKKARSKTLQNREKPNFKPFVIFKSLEFLKGPIFTAIGYTV